MACNIVLDVVKTVQLEENRQKEIDIKKYARVEKMPGSLIEDSCVLQGVIINKDVTHSQMQCYIKNLCIVLLDSSLEYKKEKARMIQRSHERKTSPKSSKWKKSTSNSSVRTLSI